MTEIYYGRSGFDKKTLKGVSAYFNPDQEESLNHVGITTYIGKTINPNRRFQLPLYVGIGGDYISGGPFGNLNLDFAAKVRAKYYFSNNMGAFIGGTFKYGIGGKTRGEEDDGYSQNKKLFYLDMGIVISL